MRDGDRVPRAAGPGSGEASAHVHVMDVVERGVSRVLIVGVGVSVALMAIGLVLGLLAGDAIPDNVLSLAELPRGLADLDPGAYLSLGVITLIATPFVRVGGSIVAFARERDGRYVLVTMVVFVVMCVSVLLGKA